MIEMKEERPAYVRFEVRAVEDRAASEKNGCYTTRNVEYALITPPYSKDCIEQEVKDWIKQLDDNVNAGRLPGKWRDHYKAAYEAWKKNEELPPEGCPIKGWPVLSPAQQQNLISQNIRTVEDLAAINDEGMKRYGMGALDLKNKAKAWLKSAASLGTVVQENASLKQRVSEQEATIKTMSEQLAQLKAAVDNLTPGKKAA